VDGDSKRKGDEQPARIAVTEESAEPTTFGRPGA
jgi:hypothetical protein